MVLQAFIDESIDDTGLVVLAGYISTAERWAAFSQEWERMLPLGTLNDHGDYHFKMSEMAQNPERMARVSGFYNIIQRHAMMSVAAIIDRNDLRRAIERLQIDYVDNIEWGEAANPYFIAYRCLMDHFHNLRLTNPERIPVSEPVDFYFDERSDKAVILQQWDEYLSKRAPEYRQLYGAMPRFENDQEFLPLQAADFRAWWIRKWAAQYGPIHSVTGMEQGEYDFQYVSKPIYTVIFHYSEENMVNVLKAWLSEGLPDDISVRDRDEFKRDDPPWPTERLAAFIIRLVKGWFGGRQPS